MGMYWFGIEKGERDPEIYGKWSKNIRIERSYIAFCIHWLRRRWEWFWVVGLENGRGS